jgi:hypothetical protein
MLPHVIYKATNIKQEFRDGIPPGTVVKMSNSYPVNLKVPVPELCDLQKEPQNTKCRFI